jgi:NADH-quinone oxidoreductase subunit L
MHHEQDMRKMGGLKSKIPFTYWMMVIGTLALTGFPFTAGYFSKDAIIEAAGAAHGAIAEYAFWLTVIAAGLTSFYSWRLIFMTFHGPTRADHHTYEHAHESPLTMLVPLALLALGALVLGFAFRDVFTHDHGVEAFFRESLFSASGNKILEELHHLPLWVGLIPTVMMAAGFLVAYWFYIVNPALPAALAHQNEVLYRFLLNKWYFDELYDFLFVRPAKWLGRFLWKQGDGWLIDGFGPDGVSARVIDVTQRAVRLQTGYLYHYAFVMLIGVAALITWFLMRGITG